MNGFILCTCLVSCGVAFARQAQDKAAFEVASIKPTDPNPANPYYMGMTADGSIVRYANITLRDCIRGAYRAQDFQIVGPDWMTNARYEIDAKLPPGASMEQIPEMLQSLLQALQAGNPARGAQNGYALVVGKAGPKLKLRETASVTT